MKSALARLYPFRFPVFLLLFLLFARTGWLDAIFNIKHVEESNAAFLHDAVLRTEETFLLVSGVLSGLELLSSSSTGFSLGLEMDVQVGDMIYHLTQTVEYIWQWLIVSGACLAVMEILLALGGLLANWLLPVALLLVLLLAVFMLLMKRESAFGVLMKKLVSLVFLLWLGLAYAFPLAVFTVAQVAEEVTGPLVQRSHIGVRDQLQGYHIDESMNKEGGSHHESRVKWAKAQVKQIVAFKKEESKGLFHHIRILVMTAVVEMVLLPALFLVVFTVLMRVLLRHLEMGHQRQWMIYKAERT